MTARILRLFLAAAPLALGSCASHRPGLVLEAIGPGDGQAMGGGTQGSLRVFSALDPAPDFNGLPYRRHYSSYKIFGTDGRLVESVDNRFAQRETAQIVQLPPGSYRVEARANGYGMVTVPVVIRANQLTTVHLEGSFSWPNSAALVQTNLVRLPRGEIAGWRVGPEEQLKP